MRIAAWNIQHGGGRRVQGILRVLERVAPDVALLSEVRGTSPSRELARGLRPLGLDHLADTVSGRDPKSNRVLVASRHPLQVEDPGRDLLARTGRWLHCRVLATPCIEVVALHVPNRSSGIKYHFHDAVVERMDALSARPILVAGDTNTGRRGLDELSPFFNLREDEWFRRIADVGWHDVHPLTNGDERVCTWRSHTGGEFRLDQAFVSEPLRMRVQSIRHLWRTDGMPETEWPSDHAMVVVQVG
jgi:exonuclease III